MHLRPAWLFPLEEEKERVRLVNLRLLIAKLHTKIYPGLFDSVPRDCGFTRDIHGSGKPEDDIVAYWVSGE